MSDSLLIVLPALAPGEWPPDTQKLQAQCQLVGSEGQALSAAEILSLEDIGKRYGLAEPGSRNVVGVLPGNEVLLTSIAVPGQRQRQIRQALPYLVEEDVATDPEQIHAVLGPTLDDGANAVAVVGKELMSYWLRALAREDLYPSMMLPETLLLPLDRSNSASLLLDGKRFIIRQGRYNGMVLENDALLAATDICIPRDASQQKSSVSLWTAAGDEQGDNMLLRLGKAIRPTRIHQEIYQAPYVSVLAAVFHHTLPAVAGLNLMTGSFESSQQRSASRQLLTRIAVAVIAIIASQALFDGSRTFYLRQQAAEMDRQAEAIYRELFPNDRRIVRLQAQMKSHLQQLREHGGDQDFIALLGTAGKYARAFPAKDFAIQRVTYSEQNGSMVMDLQVSSLQLLDRYKQALAAGGLMVDIASAVREDDAVRARLRVQRMST